jgi:hypothetical protein
LKRIATGTAAFSCREGEIMAFDYGLPAELFMAKRKSRPRQRLGYRRFATAAEAIRFAVEDFPAIHTLGVWMQVGDKRFNSGEIRRRYDSDDYPLQRGPLMRKAALDSRSAKFYKSREPRRTSIMRFALAIISSALLFSRLTGLFGHGVIEPGE